MTLKKNYVSKNSNIFKEKKKFIRPMSFKLSNMYIFTIKLALFIKIGLILPDF
jgi:hypothetical protein